MANNKSKKNKNDYVSKIDSVGVYTTNYKKVILVSSIIIIVFAIFYFLTVFITKHDSKVKTNTKNDISISYTDTIAGRSFSMPESEYLILYYDRSDSALLSDFSSLSSDYRSGDSEFVLYSVDMNDSINKKFYSEQSNTNPSNISDLAINGPTLIHFKNGKVVDYIEGDTEIKNYLS